MPINHHTESARLELRVLSGPQAGARAPLHAQQALLICGWHAQSQGETQFADILLSTQSDLQAQLVPTGAGRWALQLLEGTAELAGRHLSPGEARHAIAPGQRLKLAGVALAYGPAHLAHWPEPVLNADDAGPQAARTGTAAPMARRGLTPWQRALEWSLFTVGSVTLVVGLWLAAPGRTATPMGQARAATLPAGHATSHAGSSAAAATAAGTEQLNAVVDVFRLHGISAQASWTSQGELLLHTQEADAARVQAAAAAARRDIAHLPALRIDNQAPAAAAAATPAVNDPAKRLVAVVGHTDNPYFVTADGSRYFGGALLPSGHRVVEIAEREVVVERDGQRTRLTL